VLKEGKSHLVEFIRFNTLRERGSLLSLLSGFFAGEKERGERPLIYQQPVSPVAPETRFCEMLPSIDLRDPTSELLA
jgi:hypothetical protein